MARTAKRDRETPAAEPREADTPDTDISQSQASEQDEVHFPNLDFEHLSEEDLTALVEAVLDRLSVEALVRVIKAAENRRQAQQDEARETLLREFRARAASMGMSLDSLFPQTAAPKQGRRTRSDAGKTLAPKFRGPNGETWSGRGIAPKWLATLEAGGRNRQEFRVTS